MRAIRPLAMVFLALTLPLSRGAAQTCQGTAAFQDGRWRAGAFAHENTTVNDVGVGLAYGIPRSFYGELTVDKLQDPHATNSATGPRLAVGYQFHISDTPFQFCPEVTGHYSSGATGGDHATQVGFGGSLGYRVGISDWFTLVPAAGVSWISTNTYCGRGEDVGPTAPGAVTPTATCEFDSGTSSQVFMAIGLVFHRSFTIVPGLLIPSQSGTKSIFTLGVSINWPSDVNR